MPRKFVAGVNSTFVVVKLAAPFVALTPVMKRLSPLVSVSFTSGKTVTATFTGVEAKSFCAAGATFNTAVVTGGVTLFVGVGSPVGEPVLAVFVMLPRTGAVTVRVNVVTVFAESVPRFVQMIWLPALINPAVAETKVTFAGNASVTLKLAAEEGPLFVTMIV